MPDPTLPFNPPKPNATDLAPGNYIVSALSGKEKTWCVVRKISGGKDVFQKSL